MTVTTLCFCSCAPLSQDTEHEWTHERAPERLCFKEVNPAHNLSVIVGKYRRADHLQSSHNCTLRPGLRFRGRSCKAFIKDLCLISLIRIVFPQGKHKQNDPFYGLKFNESTHLVEA